MLEPKRTAQNSNVRVPSSAPFFVFFNHCIIENSGTPYFCFKDLDENKATGSIKIRVETIDYFLRRYREDAIRKRKAAEDIERQLAELEAQLRQEHRVVSDPQLEMPVFESEGARELQELAGD